MYMRYLILGIFTVNSMLSYGTAMPVTREVPEEVQWGNPLGNNQKARIGAHSTVALATVLTAWLSYKTMRELLQLFFVQVPFLQDHFGSITKNICGAASLPLTIFGLVKYGPLVDYFFYILYAGERISPLLARDILYNIRVYVEHIQTLKSVQKALSEIIDQLSLLSEQEVHDRCMRGFDATILDTIEQIILSHEAHIEQLTAELEQFLSADASEGQADPSDAKVIAQGYTIAADLKDETQAVIGQLHQAVEGLGTHVDTINVLLNNLIQYWQNYADGLAYDIDKELQFCRQVHAAERFVLTILNRPLVSV